MLGGVIREFREFKEFNEISVSLDIISLTSLNSLISLISLGSLARPFTFQFSVFSFHFIFVSLHTINQIVLL